MRGESASSKMYSKISKRADNLKKMYYPVMILFLYLARMILQIFDVPPPTPITNHIYSSCNLKHNLQYTPDKNKSKNNGKPLK